MATNSINTPISHADDAGFRAWVSEFITLITTGGALVQTSDTGQINTTTATRPGVSAYGGYACFRFDDTLQSTVPYFFRFDFGTGTIATTPRIALTIGTGTNGSGTITGVIQPLVILTAQQALLSTTTPYPSYASGYGGNINLGFKIGAQSGGGFFFISIDRVRDWDGSQTGEGLTVLTVSNTAGSVLMANLSGTLASYRRASGTSIPASGMTNNQNMFCLVPQLSTASVASGGSTLVYRHFCSNPDQRPMLATNTVIASEVSLAVEYDARPVGSVDRHYICLGSLVPGAAAGAPNGSTTYSIGMLYD